MNLIKFISRLSDKSLKVVAMTILALGIMPLNEAFALPETQYLGEGSASYTKDSNEVFVVKRTNPFRFDTVDSDTYTSTRKERVWTSSEAYTKIFHEWVNFGELPAGCEFSYVFIDDDVDERVNKFYLNGEVVYESPQGMVVESSFTLPKAGELKLYAADSIAQHHEISCPANEPEPEPEDDPEETPCSIYGGYGGGYGGGENCIINKSFDIEKKVRIEGDKKWKDKVTDVEFDDVVEFRVVVKNKTDANDVDGVAFDNMRMHDILPDELIKLSGDLTEDWDAFKPGEERTFIIRVRVDPDEYDRSDFDKCVVNEATVIYDGTEEGSDTATVCYSDTEDVLGIEELPETGAASTLVLTLLGLTSITSGYALKRRK
ncbi:MAG: LPXTG cell wall anchor domain-containing protein [Patescibacteria group bacterium]